MATYSDTFTGTPGTALDVYDANWSFIAGDGHDYFGINGGGTAAGVLFFGGGLRNVYRSVHGAYANDQFSEGIVENLGAATSAVRVSFCVRMSSDTGAGADYYQLEIQDDAASGASHSCTIDKVVNGSLTNLASFSAVITNGDTVRLEVTSTGLTAKLNGTPMSGGTATDSALTSGNAGITGTGTSFIRFASWGGGDLSGGGPVTVGATGSAITSGRGTASPVTSIGL